MFALAVASSALFFSACGGGSSGAGSCTYSPANTGYTYCYNYVGSGYTTASATAACNAYGASVATYSSGACATAAGGTCDVDSGTAAEYKFTFTNTSDAGSTATTQTECTTLGGTYSAM
jgi:hypothetical protein